MPLGSLNEGAYEVYWPLLRMGVQIKAPIPLNPRVTPIGSQRLSIPIPGRQSAFYIAPLKRAYEITSSEFFFEFVKLESVKSYTSQLGSFLQVPSLVD